MRPILASVIIFTLSFSIYSQVSKQWERHNSYWGMSWGNGVSMVIDSNNTPVALGQQWGWEQTPILHIQKLNPLTGSVTWDISPSYSAGQYIFTDNVNNIYVSGIIKEGFTWKNPFIAKFRPNGTQIFYKTETFTPYSDLYSAYLDSSANSYLLMKYLYWIRIDKYDSAGNGVWTVHYEELNGSNVPGAISIDKNNNDVLFCGMTNIDTTEFISFLRINQTGVITDTAKFLLNSRTGIQFKQLQTDINSNIYLIGTFSDLPAQNKYFFMKITPDMSLVWIQVYPLSSYSPPGKFFLQDDGTIIRNNSTGISKLASSGSNIWNFGTNRIYDIKTGKDNFIYACGTNGSRFYTCKINQGGTAEWEIVEQTSSYSSNILLKLMLDTSLNVYVHGSNTEGGAASGFTTIKYSQLTPILSNETQLPVRSELLQNYPNPFNPNTTISFNLNKRDNVVLAIFDISGKELFRLNQNNLNAGTYQFNWNASNYSSGIYFVKLTAGTYSDTKRIVLLK